MSDAALARATPAWKAVRPASNLKASVLMSAWSVTSGRSASIVLTRRTPSAAWSTCLAAWSSASCAMAAIFMGGPNPSSSLIGMAKAILDISFGDGPFLPSVEWRGWQRVAGGTSPKPGGRERRTLFNNLAICADVRDRKALLDCKRPGLGWRSPPIRTAMARFGAAGSREDTHGASELGANARSLDG